MKHPVSLTCAYTMLGALVVLGLAGWFLSLSAQLPPDWAGFLASAKVAAIIGGGFAFVAAAIASMRSAYHAERAWRAGAGFRHIFWLAGAYTFFCIAIEVSIGELGARALNLPLPHWLIVTGVLTGFAIAPRVVAFILSAMDGISKADGREEKDHDHVLTIEEIQARTELTRAQGEVVDIRTKAKAGVGLVGAAALLIGAGAAADNILETPEFIQVGNFTPDEPRETPEAISPEIDAEALLLEANFDARGPRRANREKFERAMQIIAGGGTKRMLVEELGIDPKTAKQWRGWALAILDRPENESLLAIG